MLFSYEKTICTVWITKRHQKLNFVDVIVIKWKFASRAFKIRFWNVFTTSGYDFMLHWSSGKKGKKRWGGAQKKNRHKIAFLAVFDQTSSERKICSRNVLDMIKTSFESLWSIFFEKNNFEIFLYFLVPFCNQNGIIRFSIFPLLNNTVLVTKRHKKCKLFFFF